MLTRRLQTGRESRQIEHLAVADLPLDCRLVRSRRKSLAVHVRHDLIEVRAPAFVGRGDILKFLDKHRNWVLRKVEEKQQRHAERLSLCDGGQILYKARLLNIELCDSSRSGVILSPLDSPQTMRLCGPGVKAGRVDQHSAAAAQVLKRWLQQQAKDYLPARTQALADYLGVGQKLKEVVFRKTRSKWGHCTSGGRIQYNWLIMLAPDGVIDYMIAHEVCHLLHMNHSAVYWQAVARVCPDYQRYVGWLKDNEHRLWF
jgi:predicted metal-dependent hydrolase